MQRLPNFDKHFFYKPPSDLYQEFANTYAYYKQATLCNPTLNKQNLLNKAQTVWKEIKNKNEAVIREKIQSYLTTAPSTIPKIKEATQRILKCQQAIKMISNQDIKNELLSKIEADSYHHHHSAKVSLASVARTDMKQHVNKHYCLASVKAARVFAAVFASDTVVILQDNKAKIGLGIPAVGHTFKTMQSINEPVTVKDHDFPKGSTSLLTHMADLLSLVNDQDFASVLLKENDIRLIWALDLDYLTVRTHVPYQSAYNPVERSMASLLEKLAGITLPIDKYGMHLDSQGNVVDEELAQYNFEFLGNRLCELWSRDDIYAPDAVLLLDQNDGFLPPIAKGMNGHYIDPIHTLQYFDKLKIPQYDSSCSSISKEIYQCLYYNKCGKYYPTLKFIANHKYQQHPSKCGRPQKQVDETVNLNFRVAEDVVDHDLLEDEISNSHEVQSENEWKLIDVRIY
ncbi:38067_t:CDS:2 [Gigaspora margarita]|uniref:38067_t:CDS:1 n=1 Tax=Gigaspora margarita TaxID=4874 RepID=A0ABN7VZP6_GIGMA|nr:38067_t:CDS:2 [Gigaspora margarita]